MTIDDYIKWANKEIEKNEFRIDAAYSVPGIHYDAEVVKGCEKNIEHYKQLVEYLEDCKKGYIHIDDVYRLIAGHSNYHGDSILLALTCIAEGKKVTKPITPLDEEKYDKLKEAVGKIKEEIAHERDMNFDLVDYGLQKAQKIIDKHLKEVEDGH